MSKSIRIQGYEIYINDDGLGQPLRLYRAKKGDLQATGKTAEEARRALIELAVKEDLLKTIAKV